MISFIVLIFGLVVGSFLNVLIYRLNISSKRAPKWWQGRSLCPNCKKTIAWFDNIPLLSFVILAGKCRKCHKAISWQYPLVESLTAVISLLIWTYSGDVSFLATLLNCSIAYIFIVIFFSDWIYGLIPDEMIVIGLVLGLLSGLGNLGWSVVTAVISGLFFLLIVLATRFRGMGLGDVKLAFLIGLLLGWPKAPVAFWVAFLGGGVVATVLLLLKKVRLSDKMAFGPYLVLGYLVSALWSGQLLQLFGI